MHTYLFDTTSINNSLPLFDLTSATAYYITNRRSRSPSLSYLRLDQPKNSPSSSCLLTPTWDTSIANGLVLAIPWNTTTAFVVAERSYSIPNEPYSRTSYTLHALYLRNC